MSDFFGDYVAPAALIAGAAGTGIKALESLRNRKGGFSQAWDQQKEASLFISGMERSQVENRYSMSNDDLLNEMDLHTSRYQDLRGIDQPFGTAEAEEAFQYARTQSVGSMVDTFGLENSMAEMGVTPETIQRPELSKLLDMSPAYGRHLQGAASSYSMLANVNIPGVDSYTQDILEDQATGASKSMIESFEQMRDAPNLGDFMNEEGRADAFSPRNNFSTTQVRSAEDLTKALGEGDLLTETHRLFERVRELQRAGKPIGMQLMELDRGQGTFNSGVRINVNGKNGSSMDIHWENAEGKVYTGHNGQREMIARGVAGPKAEEFARTGLGSSSEAASTMFTRGMADNLEQIVEDPSQWGRGIREATGNHLEAQGKVYVPGTANETKNRKIASQVTYARQKYSPEEIPLGAIDERNLLLDRDTTSGASNAQLDKGVRIKRAQGERVIGSESSGGLTGDNKRIAQLERDTRVTSPNRARATAEGLLGGKVGDVRAQVRAYSMPEAIFKTMMGSTSRFDTGYHEDTAVLLDNNIRYEEARNTTISSNSPAGKRLIEALDNPNSAFANAARSAGGVRATLKRLDSQIAYGQTLMHPSLKEDSFLRTNLQGLRDQAAEIRSASQFSSDEILGQRSQGGFIKGPKSGSFEADRVTYVRNTNINNPDMPHTGQLHIAGFESNRLGAGDKVFGMKRVLSTLESQQGQHRAALYEATKNDPKVLAAMEQINSGDKKGGQLALQQFYEKDVEAFNVKRGAAIEAAQARIAAGGKGFINFSNHEVRPEGVSRKAWSTTVDRMSDVQMLDAQGIKEFFGKRADVFVHSTVSNLANERARIMDGVAKKGRVVANPDQLADIDYSLSQLGATPKPGSDGRIYQVNDKPGARNLALDVDQALLATMDDNVSHGATSWSGKKLFEDLGNAEQMTKEQRVLAFKGLLSDESKRATALRTIQGQVQFGLQTHSIAVGGDSRKTGGSGGRGSINRAMMRHLDAQGGVMKKASLEMAGRLVGEKLPEQKHVMRRMAVFDRGSSNKSVNLSTLSNDMNPGVLKSLFGRNQQMRDEAFGAIRAQYGLEDSDHLLFNSDGKNIYHPQELSRHTGGFTTPSGDATISGVDNALWKLMNAHKDEGPKQAAKILEAKSMYADELAKISFGKKQVLTRAYSGKLQGSLRSLNVPQKAQKLFEMAKLDPEAYGNAMGISESQFRKMLTDMGAVDDYDERVKRLRLGEEAGLVARQPSVDMHRISSVKLYSTDHVLELASSNRLIDLGRDDGLIANEIMGLSRKRHAEAWERINKDKETLGSLTREGVGQEIRDDVEEKIKKIRSGRGKKHLSKNEKGQIASQKKRLKTTQFDNAVTKRLRNNNKKHKKSRVDILSEVYKDTFKSHYGDNAIFLPQHMEMILGADYDDDQLDVILGKDEKLNKALRERADYQEALRSGKVKEKATGRTDGQIRAEEDYFYKKKVNELYSEIKNVGGPKHVLTEAESTQGTPEWRRHQAGQALQAKLEKGSIGSMTNATDFARDHLRSNTARGAGEGRLFAEMILGILPETVLKANSYGPAALMDTERGIKESMETINKILGGGMKGEASAKQMTEQFNAAFMNIHGETDTVKEMLKFTPDVIASVGAGTLDHNKLSTYVRQAPTTAGEALITRSMDLLGKSASQSELSAAMRNAVEGMGVQMGGETERHMKNAAGTFEDLYKAIGKHKRPAMIGLAVSLGASILLGSPGNISEEEAMAAAGRHRGSDPTVGPTNFGHTTPVATGDGRAIRVRGRAGGQLDTSAVSRMLQGSFPGSDVSYNMTDYRERINEEYLRKRLGG